MSGLYKVFVLTKPLVIGLLLCFLMMNGFVNAIGNNHNGNATVQTRLIPHVTDTIAVPSWSTGNYWTIFYTADGSNDDMSPAHTDSTKTYVVKGIENHTVAGQNVEVYNVSYQERVYLNGTASGIISATVSNYGHIWGMQMD